MQSSPSKKAPQFKILFIGDAAVGKTSLITAALCLEFTFETTSTMGTSALS